jgi:hypothetical protein
MFSRHQGSCSLFTLPKKDFGRSLLFCMVIKWPLLIFLLKLYWEWRICLWISVGLLMGNIIYPDDPHLYWVCIFDEVNLTQRGPWKKWCTIHGYFKYCTCLPRFQNCIAPHGHRGVFLFHKNEPLNAGSMTVEWDLILTLNFATVYVGWSRSLHF